MIWPLALTLYRLVLPLLFLAAFPGWLVKMLRRGGLGSGLGERVACYGSAPPREFEPSGAIHLHAVSVGEALLALKLLREWRAAEPGARFVLATGTATGHAIARDGAPDDVRVTYAPLDFPGMVRRYLDRFEPARLVLVEGEAWPHLLLACRRRGIPVHLVNARMSPRSARRYRRFAAVVRPLFGTLRGVALQDEADRPAWGALLPDPSRIEVTGSLKIDPGGGPAPATRPEFREILDRFGPRRPRVLAASTHPGEEAWIAEAVRAADADALPILVPRHAERRVEVREALERAGFEVVLRSAPRPPLDPRRACLVIDSTGELRDWTAHADVVVIGKSFFARGGQNPCEAIAAAKPLVTGPHMENFEPLVSRLVAERACLVARDADELTAALRRALTDPEIPAITARASALLAPHRGATRRIVAWLREEMDVAQ